MKLYIYLTIILLTLSGCGGGGGSDSTSSFSGNFPTENFSGTSYDTWDYIIPATNTETNSINTNSLGSTSYSAKFEVTPTSTTEIPDDGVNEKIVYDKLADRVKISFYKGKVKTFSYEMKKSIQIGETTTVSDSACVLVNHFNTYYISTQEYNDVIQIDCGKSHGFYQKGRGEIAQNSN